MAEPVKLRKLKPSGFQFIQDVRINASPQKTWKALMNAGKWFQFAPTKQPDIHMEPWAGGRFYRKNKNGEQALFALVTLLEPNKLLRLNGSMGMSHLPVNNAFIFELQPQGKGTLLKLCQRTYGFIDAGMKGRYTQGWGKLLPQLKALAEKR